MDEATLRKLFSQNIKKYRNRNGLTQAKLAEKMGISTNYLSDIETGRGWISPFSLVKLSNALKIEVFELFKPQETLKTDMKIIVNTYIDNYSVSLKENFDKLLVDTTRKLKKSL